MDFTGVLVGLGNPGPKYDGTRHNMGFMFADLLLEKARRDGTVLDQNGGRFSCDLWRVNMDDLDGTWLVAKPTTFMNLSGQCVQPLLAWHRVTPDALVVVHDELDVHPGELRFKFGGGNAGHNGLKSITEQLGSPDFHRLRIGIGRPEFKGDVVNWVLGRPFGDAKELTGMALEAGLKVLSSFAKRGLESAVRTAKSQTSRIAKEWAKEHPAGEEAL